MERDKNRDSSLTTYDILTGRSFSLRLVECVRIAVLCIRTYNSVEASALFYDALGISVYIVAGAII